LNAEEQYYNAMWQMSKTALVGAGIGSGFIDTNKLHVRETKRNLKTPVKARTLHLPEPYGSQTTTHTAWQPRIVV